MKHGRACASREGSRTVWFIDGHPERDISRERDLTSECSSCAVVEWRTLQIR